jgi:hypothetical protein
MLKPVSRQSVDYSQRKLLLEIEVGEVLVVWSRTTGARGLFLDGPRGRLTGVSRIEAVFRAHIGDDHKILAASDQTDDG